MNYRHAYHAGNFADLVKHALVLWLLKERQENRPTHRNTLKLNRAKTVLMTKAMKSLTMR